MWPAFAILFGVCLLILAAHHLRVRHRLHQELSSAQRRVQESERAHSQAIQDVESHQRILFDSMVEGLLLLDPDGRVRLVNKALEQLFGVDQDIRGRTLMEALRLHELHDLAERVRREGQVLDHMLELTGLEPRWLEVNAAALSDGQGRSEGMLLVFHDLTRVKRMEKARREFVANVSHELRTPLSMIKGYVETLINGAKDDEKVAARFLNTISKHADRLTYLIEDLLSLSQLESGQVAISLEEVNLHDVVEEVLTDLRSAAESKEIRLDNRMDAELRVMGDTDRVRQVLFNLVDNAVKYGRPRGSVVLESGISDDRMVEIAVADDGPGIPLGTVDRVFERFYRVDRGRSREQGGTGLGLAIVKHIVQLHGGRVWADPPPQGGVVFRFTLPALPGDAAGLPASRTANSQSSV